MEKERIVEKREFYSEIVNNIYNWVKNYFYFDKIGMNQHVLLCNTVEEKQIEVLDPLASAFHCLKLKDIYSVAEVAIRLSLFSEEAGIYENAQQVCKPMY